MSARGLGPPPLTYLLLKGAARRRAARGFGGAGGLRAPPEDSGAAAGGCAAEDAVEGTNAASPRRDGETPWMSAIAKMKLLFSPVRLHTTINSDA